MSRRPESPAEAPAATTAGTVNTPQPAFRWIVTDLDGTIVGRDLRLVQRSVEAVAAFRRTGGEVYIATGRNEVSALPFHRELGLDTPAILYNGARITDLSTGERLLDRTVDRDRRLAVQRILPRLSDRFGIVGFWHEAAYALRPAESLPAYAHRDAIELLPPGGLRLANTEFSKIMIIGDPDAALEEPRALLAELGVSDDLVQSEKGYLEVLPVGADKGSALRWLAEHRGVDLAQIAAIGDNPNDAAMIAQAGLGVAVTGAHQDAIAAADQVVGRCEDGAVAELVALVGKG